MEVVNIILGALTLATALGAIAATFYGVRQKTIITTLEQSNAAYAERNRQLEEDMKRMHSEHAAAIAELTGRVIALEKIKTPPFKPMMELIQRNHTEVLAAIRKEKK